MKNITFLALMLLSAVVQAQIINFPDPAFKGFLLAASPQLINVSGTNGFITLDTNGDQEIDVTEALAARVFRIDSYPVKNFEGIQYFTNLEALEDHNSFPEQLSLDGLDNLLQLDLGRNNISFLDASNHVNIQYIAISSFGALTSINITNCAALEVLACGGNQGLTSLDLSNKPNLSRLYVFETSISSLDLSGAPMLETLSITENPLLTELDLSHTPGLINLQCRAQPITSLDFTHNYNLQYVRCPALMLGSIDVSMLHELRELDVADNPLTTIDVSGLPLLYKLNCAGTHIETVDISANHALSNLNCSGMPSLRTVFMKNGPNNILNETFGNDPLLAYICADDSEVEAVRNYLSGQGMSNVIVSSYCTFVPGGTYNTLSGQLHYDRDGDGYDAADPALGLQWVDINDGVGTTSTLSNTDGNYRLYVPAGNYTISPRLHNGSWFAISPVSASVTFPVSDGTINTQDFCIAPQGSHQDLVVTIVRSAAFRPGFESGVKIIYQNIGNMAISDTIGFTYDDSVLDVVSSVPAQSASASGTLMYSFEHLGPFETREIDVRFHLNAPTDTPPGNAGEALAFVATINPIATDETPGDNVFRLSETVVNSVDPNAKQCLEGDSVPDTEIGKYLHYNIEFENTGTAPAQNIVVTDLIDTAKFDMSSLEVIYSSAPVYIRVKGNKAEFIFEGINLPNDPETRHGNVVFRIRTIESLSSGDQVANTANIYFDYNAPVATNTATTTFATLAAQQFVIDDSIRVYPNPASGFITIAAKSDLMSISVFDIQGRILQTISAHKKEITIDISDKQKGIYFLKITTSEGSKIEKLVKE